MNEQKEIFGSLISANLPMLSSLEGGKEIDCKIHVLPEVVELGNERGRPVKTVLDHFAITTPSFDPTKPAVVFVYKPDVLRDIFSISSNERNRVRETFEKLNQGQNGILLCMETLSAIATDDLSFVDPGEMIKVQDDDVIVDQFKRSLSISNQALVIPLNAPVSVLHSRNFNLDITTDVGPFRMHRRNQIAPINITEQALQELLPREAEKPEAERANFIKHLSHYAMVALDPKAPRPNTEAPLVRIHSSCTTGDLLGSARCECGQQLPQAMKMVAEEGGAVIYHDAEGRGVFLLSLKALFHRRQDENPKLNTYTAMQSYDYSSDERVYSSVAQLLRDIGMPSITPITNNPNKIKRIGLVGIKVEGSRSIIAEHISGASGRYLHTKIVEGGHAIPAEFIRAAIETVAENQLPTRNNRSSVRNRMTKDSRIIRSGKASALALEAD